MAKQFRVNQIILSGKDLSIDPNDSINYFRRDGVYANPVSGYVKSSETGSFITTGQTGNFGSSSGNTGLLTGAFYPLKENPSGYLTSSATGNLADQGYVNAVSGALSSRLQITGSEIYNVYRDRFLF